MVWLGKVISHFLTYLSMCCTASLFEIIPVKTFAFVFAFSSTWVAMVFFHNTSMITDWILKISWTSTMCQTILRTVKELNLLLVLDPVVLWEKDRRSFTLQNGRCLSVRATVVETQVLRAHLERFFLWIFLHLIGSNSLCIIPLYSLGIFNSSIRLVDQHLPFIFCNSFVFEHNCTFTLLKSNLLVFLSPLFHGILVFSLCGFMNVPTSRWPHSPNSYRGLWAAFAKVIRRSRHSRERGMDRTSHAGACAPKLLGMHHTCAHLRPRRQSCRAAV